MGNRFCISPAELFEKMKFPPHENVNDLWGWEKSCLSLGCLPSANRI